MNTKVRYKEWVLDEAARRGVCQSAITNSVARGLYPKLKRERVNARVMFVLNPNEETFAEDRIAKPGEMRAKDWYAQEAKRCGVSIQAIVNRVTRGRYSNVKRRVVSQSLVFISINP